MEIGYRVLAVDDEPAVRDLVARSLTSAGLSCDMAADGVEASEMIDRDRYDLIVLDLWMPRRPGHQLAHALLDREERPLILVLTGIAESSLVLDLLKRGVDDVIFKPIDPYLLADRVKGLLAGCGPSWMALPLLLDAGFAKVAAALDVPTTNIPAARMD